MTVDKEMLEIIEADNALAWWDSLEDGVRHGLILKIYRQETFVLSGESDEPKGA